MSAKLKDFQCFKLTDFAIGPSIAKFLEKLSIILSDTGRPLALTGNPSPDLMQQLPMVIIPAYGVPFFIILHLITWLKLRSE